jgi:cytochrome c oxidase cbb3-type subunit 4
MDYTFMREFADSWGLIYLFVIFIAAVAFTFRPGSKDIADKISRIPLEEDRDDG